MKTKSIKLSTRAKKVLSLIREVSLTSEGKPCERFFVPSAYPVYSKLFSGESIQVQGSGDGAIIKYLIRKGLAVDQPFCAYACEITPLGIEVYDSLVNDPDVVESRKKDEAEQERLKKEWGDD